MIIDRTELQYIVHIAYINEISNLYLFTVHFHLIIKMPLRWVNWKWELLHVE